MIERNEAWIVIRRYLLEDQRRWNILIAVALFMGTGWIFLTRLPSGTTNYGEQPAPRKGFYAPEFSLELLSGGQVTLSDLRGKVVLVNFWASWCPPCRLEMPAIEKAANLYKERDVVILGVNTTYQDSEKNAATFVKDHNLTFAIPLDRDGKVSKQYTLSGLPTTFFIDRTGVIRSVVVGGPMSEGTILSQVEDLLKGNP